MNGSGQFAGGAHEFFRRFQQIQRFPFVSGVRLLRLDFLRPFPSQKWKRGLAGFWRSSIPRVAPFKSSQGTASAFPIGTLPCGA